MNPGREWSLTGSGKTPNWLKRADPGLSGSPSATVTTATRHPATHEHITFCPIQTRVFAKCFCKDFHYKVSRANPTGLSGKARAPCTEMYYTTTVTIPTPIATITRCVAPRRRFRPDNVRE